jgi:putative ABC transport system permease protein
MNFIKRAFRSLIYYRGNTVIRILIFLIMSSLVLTSINTYTYAKEYFRELKSKTNADVEVTYKQHTMGTLLGNDNLSLDVIKDISGISEVDGYSLFVEGIAKPIGFTATVTDLQKEKFHDWGELALYGNTRTTDNTDFFYGRSKLIEGGRYINEGDTSVCLISEKTALDNKLGVGDKISIIGFIPSNDSIRSGKTAELEIIGIYVSSGNAAADDSPEYNPDNAVYTTPEIVMETCETANVASAIFHIDDSDKCDSFIAKTREITNNDDKYAYTININEYSALRNYTGKVELMSFLIVIASILMGSVISILLIINNTNGRKREINILISIGEKKAKIVIQILVEMLACIMLGEIISIPVSTVITAMMRSAFSFDKIYPKMPVQIYAMLGLGILLILIASVPVIYLIYRYDSRKTISEME